MKMTLHHPPQIQCHQYLSCFCSDFNQTLKVGLWDQQQWIFMKFYFIFFSFAPNKGNIFKFAYMVTLMNVWPGRQSILPSVIPIQVFSKIIRIQIRIAMKLAKTFHPDT